MWHGVCRGFLPKSPSFALSVDNSKSVIYSLRIKRTRTNSNNAQRRANWFTKFNIQALWFYRIYRCDFLLLLVCFGHCVFASTFQASFARQWSVVIKRSNEFSNRLKWKKICLYVCVHFNISPHGVRIFNLILSMVSTQWDTPHGAFSPFNKANIFRISWNNWFRLYITLISLNAFDRLTNIASLLTLFAHFYF